MANASQAPVAEAQMLIRRPVAAVFDAFIDPAVTTHFWFSKSSGRLETGKRIRWDWEMYGAGTHLDVKAVEPNARILIEWNVPDSPAPVEWTFQPRGDTGTLVMVRNWGFRGDPDQIVAAALDSKGGFSLMLASLKAWLEHGIELNLILDHNPDALVEAWRR